MYKTKLVTMKISLKNHSFLPVILLLSCNLTNATTFAIRDTLKAGIYTKKAKQLTDSSKYDSSAYYYRLAAHEFKKAKQWEKYFSCSNNSITAARKTGQSENLTEEAFNTLTESIKKFGEDHKITGDCYNILGNIYSDMHESDTAMYYFRKALENWITSSDSSGENIAIGYKNIAVIYIEKGQYDSGTVYIRKSLEIFTKLFGEYHEKVAGCYNSLGIIAYHLGEVDSCEKFFSKSAEIKEQVYGPDHPSTAEAYNNLASFYQMTGNYPKALELHLKAYTIRLKKFGLKHSMTALSLNNLGNVYHSLGEIEKSLDYHLKALEIRQAIFDSLNADICMSYTNLGVLYRDMGVYQKSLDYFQKALQIQILRFGLDNPYTANAYNNMGAIYASMGNYNKSLDYLKEALELRRKKGEFTPYVAGSYNNIGAIYKYKGDYELALAYYNRSIQIKKQLFGETHPEIASTIDNIGEIMLIKDNPDSARACFEKSLAMQKQIYGEDNPELASAYINLGATFSKLGNLDEEYNCYLTGLDLTLRNYDTINEWTSDFYGNISTNLLERGFPDSALFYQRKSIDIANKIYLSKHPNLSISYRSLAEIFEKLDNLDSARYYYNKALQVNYNTNLDLKNPDINDILDEEEFIQDLLNLTSIDYKLWYKLNEPDYLNEIVTCFGSVQYIVTDVLSDFTIEETKINLVNLISEKSHIAVDAAYQLYKQTGNTAYRNKTFGFSELTKAAVLQNVIYKCDAEVQSDIPDDLLQDKKSTSGYMDYLGAKLMKYNYVDDLQKQSDERKKDSLVMRLKDIRDEIDQKLIDNNIVYYPNYGSLLPGIKNKLRDEEIILSYFLTDSSVFCFAITSDTVEISKTPLNTNMNELVHHYLASLKKFESENYIANSNILYKLLIKPNTAFLKGKKSINIIPDKYLLFLPFETLVETGETQVDINDFQNLKYLITNYEISYHFNLGLWLKEKETDKKCPVSFLGFAPVFSEKNGEVPAATSVQPVLAEIKSKELLRSVSLDGNNFNELPYTKQEIDTLKNLFETKGYHSKTFLFQDASEKNFRNEAHNFRFIHIASHGIVDNKNAELTGLVFAPPVDNQNATFLNDSVDMNNGILYAHELYNMNINADLVVLSACETGLGKFEKGEGILGLTRGFLYAGVPNIVYSFWKVDDKSTMQFMTSFYKKILDNKSYSVALRETKLEMIKNSNTAYPLFWGSFALIGN